MTKLLKTCARENSSFYSKDAVTLLLIIQSFFLREKTKLLTVPINLLQSFKRQRATKDKAVKQNRRQLICKYLFFYALLIRYLLKQLITNSRMFQVIETMPMSLFNAFENGSGIRIPFLSCTREFIPTGRQNFCSKKVAKKVGK